MREDCCQFGEGAHLSGVVTEPQTSDRRRGVLLVGAGLVPKPGPFRLYVELARRLSSEGCVTLRFDLGGIGDSRQALTGLPLRERTALEIRDALEWLCDRYRLDRITIGGLCSGAEDSFRFAEHDHRIDEVVMIDPFAYRTRGFLPRHLGHRIMRRTRRALGLFRPIPRDTAPTTPGGDEKGRHSLIQYEYMAHDESTRILRTLLARRVRSHFIYTGGVRETFNHPGQLRRMFDGIDLGRLVTVDHLPRLDHTQMLADDRRVIVETIAARVGS